MRLIILLPWQHTGAENLVQILTFFKVRYNHIFNFYVSVSLVKL